MLATVALPEDHVRSFVLYDPPRHPSRVEKGLGIEGWLLLRFHDEISSAQPNETALAPDYSGARSYRAKRRNADQRTVGVEDREKPAGSPT
jgi:hypothetical protein